MAQIVRHIRKYQARFHRTWVTGKRKRLIQIAHRRWGKDEMALQATCQLAHERVAGYWHCLPEYAQARKAIWTAVNPHTGKRRIDEAFPPHLCKSRSDRDMFIEFNNGSTWQIIGSDRYDATMGTSPAGIVYSEWALGNPAAWGYHRPILVENDGWAAFITTPRGKNHAKRMYDLALQTPETWYAEHSPVTATGVLSEEELKESLREYIMLYGEDAGKAVFDQEYMCSFTAAIMGAYYALEMQAVHNEGRVSELEIIPGVPIHTAWDIGVADMTTIWFFQVFDGCVHILNYYSNHSQGVDHYAEIVKSYRLGHTAGFDYVPHDIKVREWGNKGRTRVEAMQMEGLNPKLVPNATFDDGLQAVRQTLPLTYFHTSVLETGIAALEEYKREWDEENKTFKKTPLHNWASHGADGFRYLSLSWQEAAKSQPTADDILAALKKEPTLNELVEAHLRQKNDLQRL